MIEVVYDRDTTIYIGQSQIENSDLIAKGDNEDIWIHAFERPSCHVVIISNNYSKYSKKELSKIIRRGVCLCKSHTNKIKSVSNVKFICNRLKNIERTCIPGKVNTNMINTRYIII